MPRLSAFTLVNPDFVPPAPPRNDLLAVSSVGLCIWAVAAVVVLWARMQRMADYRAMARARIASALGRTA